LGGPVVSLTTHGERILKVHLAIESVALGHLLPSRIILWLDDSSLFQNLPAPIRRLQDRGLEVLLTRNYGPHTKYYPYIESEHSFHSPLVTADDDIIYPRYWLRTLIEAYREFSNAVNCYRARVVEADGHDMRPYHTWELCTSTDASFRNVPTGVSGTVYPPSFQSVLKKAGSAFEACCPANDDIWLHVQAIRAGIKVRQISRRARHFPIIPGTQKVSLYRTNVTQDDGNDQQAKATYQETDLEILRNSETVRRTTAGSPAQRT
jgi:hypothetical protein